MDTLSQLIRKEALVLRRDWHAMALLFLMPAFFILVMSLAMRNLFATGPDTTLTYFVVNGDTTAAGGRLAEALRTRQAFRQVLESSPAARADAIRRGDVLFEVQIPEGFARTMIDSAPRPITVVAGPAVSPPTAQLFGAAVREAVTGVYLPARLAAAIPLIAATGAVDTLLRTDDVNRLVQERTLYASAASARRPTSVQQNVPAWLVFAMFFVALPLSTTWLQERTQGTFAKLRSIGISPSVLLLGKLVPYLMVNLVQVVIMLAVGVWVVPALGGDALTLGHSIIGLLVIALAVGAAAVSYGLLIANLVATTEQATIVTGASNLLLGALGGVMVPRHVMPMVLQKLALLSPMSWGLEGFLDILLRDGELRTVAPKALLLFGFALISLLLAGMRMRRARFT